MASWRAERRGLVLALALAVLAVVADPVLAGRPQNHPKAESRKHEPSSEPFRGGDLTVSVNGFVFCAKACVDPKSKAPSTGVPINGAIVSVTCINLYGLKTDYRAAKTNDKGYFVINLYDYDYSAFGVSHCKATVVSVPGPCHFVTDLNKGHSGAPLEKKKSVKANGVENISYTVGPFYTVPGKCAHGKPAPHITG